MTLNPSSYKCNTILLVLAMGWGQGGVGVCRQLNKLKYNKEYSNNRYLFTAFKQI